MNWTELVGYLGSLLVISSLTQSRVLTLRILSLSGAVIFIIYASLISSLPVLITNTFILGINSWHIWKITTGREEFSLLEVAWDAAYIRRFLEFHADEIAATQPDFTGVREGDTIVLVLRDMVPTLVVIGRPREGGIFRVYLDYAIPMYRDFKSGPWLFDHRADFFHRLGVDRIVATGVTESHVRYLRRAGFVQREDGKWERPVGTNHRRR